MAMPYVAALLAAYGLYRWSPSLALIALLCSEPFAFEKALYATTITLPKVVLLGVAFGVALDVLRGRMPVRPASSRWVFLACAALIAATALSVTQAANVGDAIRETFKSIEYALLIFVAWYIATREGAKNLATALPFLVVAVCATALLDLWFGAKSVVLIDGVKVPRVAGVLEGPNQLGGWIALLFPFVLVHAATAKRLAQQYANTVAVFVAVFTAMLTYSRAGLVTIALAWICILAFVRSRLHAGLSAVILIAALGGLVVSSHYTPGALAYLASASQETNTGGVGTRPVLWTAAAQLWQSHPLLGVGAGNFEDSLPLVGARNIKTHSNNVYLQAVVEGGPPLLFATLTLLFAPLFFLSPYVWRNAALAATYAAAWAFALHGLVDDLWFFPKVATMWCLFIGVAAASVDSARRNALPTTMEWPTLAPARLPGPKAVPELQPVLAQGDTAVA